MANAMNNQNRFTSNRFRAQEKKMKKKTVHPSVESGTGYEEVHSTNVVVLFNSLAPWTHDYMRCDALVAFDTKEVTEKKKRI